MKKPIRRPSFCANCGKPVDVVRHVMANMFEMHCVECDFGAVVMADDRVALPSCADKQS